MGEDDHCGTCLYWDHRKEVEVDEHTGYCSILEMMKRDDSVCPEYKMRTTASEQEYYAKLYNDGTDYQTHDLSHIDL